MTSCFRTTGLRNSTLSISCWNKGETSVFSITIAVALQSAQTYYDFYSQALDDRISVKLSIAEAHP